MALEIERRFLLKNDKWKNFVTKKSLIEQGYLSNNLDGWITRIRFNGNDYKLTLKRHIKNFTNSEFEYLIPNNDGEKIMSNLSNTIKKDRFFLEVEKKTWVVDCFKEKNHPLAIAEIELKSESETFNNPSFVSKEITGLRIFSNFSLSTYPFSKWTSKDLTSFKK